MNFTVGVIISTYNNPAYLSKTLRGYINQSVKADEIVIADDGSRDDTRRLIEEYAKMLPIRHVWHEDRGFQKSEILNKALVASTSDYLIFTDQDCIPRRDFIETHCKHAEKGRFVSGGYFRLPMDISLSVTDEEIDSGDIFSLPYLRSRGLKWTFKCTKLLNVEWVAKLMNAITPAKASWNGCNASTWREYAIRVNGFNEEMHYGGQDREFGERLNNLGIRGKQLRYSVICLHLDHARPYATRESIEHNRSIRREVRRNRVIETPQGIRKGQM